ncbi:unnamed protein product [Meloidogyne enterolobii]|uniref:Uncharacterized protein n=1 Tax=Meloidogyne enterolobii TaxID=390850 RepID=A0ACB0Z5S2_MELEN
MGIFPRMEKLLVLNLRGNNLEHVGMDEKSFSHGRIQLNQQHIDTSDSRYTTKVAIQV